LQRVIHLQTITATSAAYYVKQYGEISRSQQVPRDRQAVIIRIMLRILTSGPPLSFKLDSILDRGNLTRMTTIVQDQGQIVLPNNIRRRDHIQPGQRFAVERLDCGDYRLTREDRASEGRIVDWLLTCPEKGYFVGIDSESTDTL
jgi:hypothetical protein